MVCRCWPPLDCADDDLDCQAEDDEVGDHLPGDQPAVSVLAVMSPKRTAEKTVTVKYRL